MARCEDYPCCGHVGSDGPCPDFDPDTGKQLNMRCVCGAEVPLTSRSSLCRSCLSAPDEDGFSYGDDDYDFRDEEDEDEEDEDDVEPCGDCGETRDPCSCSLAARREEYYAHGDD